MEYEAVTAGRRLSTSRVLLEREQPMTTPALPRMTGPYPALDQYGRLDHYYWKCASCGLELTNLGHRDWRHGRPRSDAGGRGDSSRRAESADRGRGHSSLVPLARRCPRCAQ